MKQKNIKIGLYTPYSLNEIGGRGNNEDAIYPPKGQATGNDRLYLVCDGVGGQHKGEEASALLSREIPAFLMKRESGNIDEFDALNALKHAEEKMDQHVQANPDCQNMASTLTLLYFNTNSAFAMWAGDSRIYQVRNGEIIFKSKDHSLVNHLVELGEITEKEAENHPRKNMILKAVTPGENVTPSIVELTDIKAGDYFFMCTDGVLEQVNDQTLQKLCSGNRSCKEIIDEVYACCQGKTKDNFSAYIIQVENGSVSAKAIKNIWNENRNLLLLVAIGVAVVILAALVVLFRPDIGDEDSQSSVNTTSVVQASFSKDTYVLGGGPNPNIYEAQAYKKCNITVYSPYDGAKKLSPKQRG